MVGWIDRSIGSAFFFLFFFFFFDLALGYLRVVSLRGHDMGTWGHGGGVGKVRYYRLGNVMLRPLFPPERSCGLN